MATDTQQVDASGSFELTLLVEVPGSQDQEVFVQHGLTIGRGQSNTICIDDEAVERLHARVIRKPDRSLAAECEGSDARIVTDSGETVSQVTLTPGVSFHIGPATMSCRRRETRVAVVVADSPWEALCPRCRNSMVDLPPDTTKCPSCGLGVCFFRSAGAEPGSPGFAGWLPLEVGPYRIRAFAAEGGMGIVLRGLHVKTEMPAAVKLLKESTADASWLARFEREGDTLKRLVHPNLVRLQASGRDGHMHWLATDWVDGLSLSNLVRLAKAEKKVLPTSWMAGILRQVVHGLGYLHKQGIVHRDLKPSNILVSRDSSVKLIDLGIARSAQGRLAATALTITGTAVGTEGYMAPEQLDGREVSAATDVFALGVLWYELVTGRRAVGTYLPMKGFRPDIPETWDTLAARCLSYDGSARPSLSEIAEGLSSPADTTAVASGSLTILPDETEAPVVRGKRWLGTAALVVLGIGLCVGGYFGYQWWTTAGEKRALEAKGEAEHARSLAEKGDAKRLVPALWDQGEDSYKDGVKSFDKPDFPEATKCWSRAKDEFARAKTAAEAITVRVEAKDAKQQAIIAGARRFARSLWDQADKLYQEGDRLLNERHFPEATQCFLKARDGFAKSAAEVIKARDKAEAIKIRGEAEDAREQARVVGAPRFALALWPKAEKSYIDGVKLFGKRDYAEARDCWSTAKGEFAKAKSVAEAITAREEAMQQARDAAKAARESYGHAERKATDDLKRIPKTAPAWKPVLDALEKARSAEAAKNWTTAVRLYRKAEEDLLPKVATLGKQVQVLEVFRRKGEISEDHLAEGRDLLTGRPDTATAARREVYISLVTGRIERKRLGDALKVITLEQEVSGLLSQDEQLKKLNAKLLELLKIRAPTAPEVVQLKLEIASLREKLLGNIQDTIKKLRATITDMLARDYGEGYRYLKEIRQQVRGMTDLLFRLGGSPITIDLGARTMVFVLVPSGKFFMGSPKSEKERGDNEGPRHEVTITKPFYMGVYEVTQEQYKEVMEKSPSNFKGLKNPVEQVSWNDAKAFCGAFLKKTGKTVRLPTEAEWEYACRAGTTGRFSFGDSYKGLNDHVWHLGNSEKKPQRVGQKKPNPWGLYDMHGNVYELCSDWYAKSYPNGKAVDPQGPRLVWGMNRVKKVVRGGAYDRKPSDCRSAHRDWAKPILRSKICGFRVVIWQRGPAPPGLPYRRGDRRIAPPSRPYRRGDRPGPAVRRPTTQPASRASAPVN